MEMEGNIIGTGALVARRETLGEEEHIL